MFTGIITDVGRIEAIETRGDLRVRVACGYDMAGVDLGASIACSGVCLTVVDKEQGWFAVDVSAETQSRTAPGLWTEGGRLNLERALKVGDELGGHIVTGHVDGVGAVDGGRLGRRFAADRDYRRARTRPLHRRQGVDRARRRVADRQRGRTPARRRCRLHSQHHPAYRGADQLRRHRARPPRSTSRSIYWRAISGACSRFMPARCDSALFYHIVM